MNLIYTHVHSDHTIGLPFASFIYIKGNNIHVYGNTEWDKDFSDLLKHTMTFPNFPVCLSEINRAGATMNYNNIREGEVLSFGKNQEIRVYNAKLNHPGDVMGYRVEYDSKVFTLATDVEHLNPIEPKLLKLAQNADVLFYDTQYTDNEYNGKTTTAKKGYGHSTPEYAVKTAISSGVKRLILTHHCPSHTDEDIAKIESITQKLFPNCQAAYEGMTIDV